jgi:hypothetical protein
MKKLLLTALSVFGIFFICRAQIMEAEDDTYGGFESGINVGAYFANSIWQISTMAPATKMEETAADRVIDNPYRLNDINEVLEQNGFRYPLEEGLLFHRISPKYELYAFHLCRSNRTLLVK